MSNQEANATDAKDQQQEAEVSQQIEQAILKDVEMADENKEEKINEEDLEDQEYSVFLTRSSIENFYGQYLFYKMQLLHDTNQDVYLILTRWGQIGEDGMHQRTPFETLNKAKKEYHKIFKEKTGNEFRDIDKFKRVERKFSLTKETGIAFNYKELLVNFDWKKAPKSKLDKKVRGLIRSFAHPGYYRERMNVTAVNTNALPISSIK